MLSRPQQIVPGQPFTVSYFIRDPFDANTYYLQAVMYEVSTGAILKTVNLTPTVSNSRLYTATIDAPGDSYGFGREVMVIASVYTDSLYTTKSENYQEQEQVYLIKADTTFVGGGSDSGNMELLSEQINESVTRILDAIRTEDANEPKHTVTQIEKHVPAPIPVGDLFKKLDTLNALVKKIPVEDTDTSVIENQLSLLKGLIQTILDEGDDFSPITSLIEKMTTEIMKSLEQNKQEVIKNIALIRDEIKGIATEVSKETVQKMVGEKMMVPIDMRSFLTDHQAQQNERKGNIKSIYS